MPPDSDITANAESASERPDLDRQVRQALRSISRISALQRAAIPAGPLTVLAYLWVRFMDPHGFAREILLLIWQVLFWMGALLAIPLKRTALRAAAINDVRAIGPLLEALAAPRRRDVEGIHDVITRLLLLVRQPDGDSLSTRQLNILGTIPTAVLNRYSIPLRIAAVRAMEKIGDQGSLRALEKAAAQAESPEVRKAAQEALPALRERVERLKEAGQLLRPADQAGSATLLQPAASYTAGDDQLLLRSTTPGV